jgi:hypothetical protein
MWRWDIFKSAHAENQIPTRNHQTRSRVAYDIPVSRYPTQNVQIWQDTDPQNYFLP